MGRTADLTRYWHIDTFGAELCRRKLGVWGGVSVCVCVCPPPCLHFLNPEFDIDIRETKRATTGWKARRGHDRRGRLRRDSANSWHLFFFFFLSWKDAAGRRGRNRGTETGRRPAGFTSVHTLKLSPKYKKKVLFSRQKRFGKPDANNPGKNLCRWAKHFTHSCVRTRWTCVLLDKSVLITESTWQNVRTGSSLLRLRANPKHIYVITSEENTFVLFLLDTTTVYKY